MIDKKNATRLAWEAVQFAKLKVQQSKQLNKLLKASEKSDAESEKAVLEKAVDFAIKTEAALEKVQKSLKEGGLKSQNLLIPEIITLDDDARHLILEKAEFLEKFGFVIETFGVNQVIVRAVPAFLDKADITQLIKDLVDDFADQRGADSLTEKIYLICATFACHHSIRAGRKLNIDEMNHLLREMETTAGSGQCNHGRPTYIEIGLDEIEKLFARK